MMDSISRLKAMELFMKKFQECLEKLGSLLKKCLLISLTILRSTGITHPKLSKSVAYKRFDRVTALLLCSYAMFLLHQHIFILSYVLLFQNDL